VPNELEVLARDLAHPFTDGSGRPENAFGIADRPFSGLLRFGPLRFVERPTERATKLVGRATHYCPRYLQPEAPRVLQCLRILLNEIGAGPSHFLPRLRRSLSDATRLLSSRLGGAPNCILDALDRLILLALDFRAGVDFRARADLPSLLTPRLLGELGFLCASPSAGAIFVRNAIALDPFLDF
jgi:hypothetical protein